MRMELEHQIDPQIVRHVPNVLSVMRIPLSLTILFVKPFSAWFIALYLACGATDALDGFIARKYQVETQAGARIDSLADIVFSTVALYVFLTAIAIPPLIILWAFTIVTVRVIGLMAAFSKFRSYAALHTYAYKVVSFVFFCFPLFYALMGAVASGIVICTIASFATAEEIYINKHSATLNLDVRGMYDMREALTEGK